MTRLFFNVRHSFRESNSCFRQRPLNAFVMTLSLLLTPLQLTAGELLNMNLPAGPLRHALIVLAEDNGLELVYETGLAEDLKTDALQGRYTLEQVLEKLLVGTDIRYRIKSDKTIILSRDERTVLTTANLIAAAGEFVPAEGKHRDATTNGLDRNNGDATLSSVMDDFVVTGHQFLSEDTSGITNLPLPIEKVPQSISLLNNDFVKAADLKTMAEVAQYTTGGLWASYIPSYGNQFWLRGFSANYAIDGLTVGDQIADPDPAILERYEIVKGPASVVYNAQSPGGIVNLVSKSAAPGTPSYLEVLGGFWDRWRVEGQVAGSLNDSGTLRGIGVAAHQEGGSFIDFVKLNKTVVYGGLDFDLTDNLTGYVRTSYQRTENTPYNGIPTFPDGSVVPVSRSFFVGGSDLNNIGEATRVDAGLMWQMSDLWSFDLKSIFQHTTHEGQNAYPYDFIAFDGTFPIGGENFDDWQVDDFTIAASTMRKLDDFGLTDSSISANFRYQHYRYDIYERFLSGATGIANIFDGDRAVSDVFNSLTIGTGSYQQDQRMDYLTGSVQAVVKVLDPLTLVGGVAYSNPMIESQINDGPFENFDTGDQVNYRAGAIFEPFEGLNLYASYSESFLPNLRVDPNFDVLPPLSGTQYEVGAKYVTPNRRLLLTTALFEIEESNVPVFFTVIGGESVYKAKNVRHQGFELEATGQLADRWQIKGGLALLNPRVTKDPDNPINNGETRPWLPQTTANLYTSYEFENGFSVAGGMRYVGSVKTYDNSSSSRTPNIPSYLVFDAGIGYSIDRFHLQLNVKNIFDRHYNVASPIWQALWAGLYPGEPLSVALSARMDF